MVPHDRLLMKLAVSGVDWSVVVWVRELLVDRTQRVKAKLFKEVSLTSVVLQGSVLGPLLFVM